MKVFIFTSRTDLPEAHLCLGLRRQGIDLHVWCEESSPHRALLTEAGIPCRTLAFKSRFDLASIRTLHQLFRNERPDVAHYCSSRALTSGLMASRGLPLRHVAYRGTVGHLSRFGLPSRLSYLHRRLDRIVCVSEAVRRYFLTLKVPESKVITIYKGHDLSWYAAPKGDLSQFGIPAGATVISCAANMRPVKGVDVLVKAFDLLPDDETLHLLLVGEVRDAKIESLLQGLRHRSRVHVTGFRGDAVSLVGATDIFVMPSISREGLPKAVIEAMAQGVAPIVTSVGGMPELVVDKECGLVVPPSDPAAIAGGIVTLARDAVLRKRFGVAAQHRISTDFHISRTIQKTLALYEELLSSQTS